MDNIDLVESKCNCGEKHRCLRETEEKAVFDSVDYAVPLRCLSLKHVVVELISLIQSPYVNNRSRVHDYGEASLEFTMRSVVRQRCPLSPFSFNFVIEM